jgi:hypothetical protein
MAVQYLTNRNPDGTALGYDANDLIGFYGTTPIVQRSGGAQAAVSTTTIAPVVYTTPSGWTDLIPFVTAAVTAINLMITRQAANYTLNNELRASLVALGAIAGA